MSRAEDLQVLALPLCLIAIGGYRQAVMALSGGISPAIRLASYIPFWSPFVMLTRLTVGHVDPWELVLSFGLLAASIPIVAVIAVRVYSAGVLLFAINVWRSRTRGSIAGPNPWDGPTLEWSVPSPPPPYNCATLPIVASRHPLWENNLDEGSGRTGIPSDLLLDEGRGTRATHAREAGAGATSAAKL